MSVIVNQKRIQLKYSQLKLIEMRNITIDYISSIKDFSYLEQEISNLKIRFITFI